MHLDNSPANFKVDGPKNDRVWSAEMNIENLRAQWSDVLDYLERIDRMAWITFFDARLARIDGRTLHLDFSDSRKFSGNLEYGSIQDQHKAELQRAIKSVTGAELDVVDGT